MNSPPTLEALTEQLTRIASARGCDPKQVTLTSVSTASLLLGLEAGYSPMLAAIANHVDTVGLVVQQWDWWQQSFPFLRGHLEPITGWLNHPGAGQRETLVKQLQLLSTIDLPQMAEQPAIAGDLLGQVLTLLSAPGDRSARGAFYTPPSLAAVIAQMGESVAPSDRILDACCGGGAWLSPPCASCEPAARSPSCANGSFRTSTPMPSPSPASPCRSTGFAPCA